MTIAVYTAKVTNNEDPEKRGRIRVTSSDIMGDEEEEIPQWVEPVPSWGWFVVPDVGELIEVEGIEGLPEDEQFHQASIDSFDLKWRSSRRFHGNSESEDAATPVPDIFTEKNYGKRRGMATPAGHTLMFDDTKKDLQVSLTWKGPAGLSTLTFDKAGSIILEVHTGEKITVDTEANEIRVAAPKVVIESGEVDLGGGATDVSLLANTFLSMFAGHIHPTAMGPSGPPQVGPSTPTTPWDSAKSTTVKVKA
jgi:hypothetical protein